MINSIKKWFISHKNPIWFYPVAIILTAILFITSPIVGNRYIWLYLGIFGIILFIFRPNSSLYNITLEKSNLYKIIISFSVAIITVLICVWPMGKFPLWNGEKPEHRNQYELMAESILNGRIDIDYGDDDEELSKLSNPYDPELREKAGVKYHWDHAYYNGRYYMYFGVVPVFLVFLPYRFLTGNALATYHATQIFVAFAILGIFMLFYLLSKLFFKKLPFISYLALSVAFSAISVWFGTAQPALYCTAITSAMALEIWSLYFFIRAVWYEKSENRQILFAFFGALLGALAFGCRPPIAIANILVIPMFIVFIKQRKFSFKILGKLFIVALPYILVAAGLMIYNYARFNNPFEFGQAYQLTVADQTNYKITFDSAMILRIINESFKNFFGFTKIDNAFPFIKARGVFFSFPILFLCIGLFKTNVIKNLRKNKLLPLVIGFFLTVLIITAADIMWTPFLLERYRMDIYYLMCIACFIIVGFWHNSLTQRQRSYLNFTVFFLSSITVISSFLFCINVIGYYYPETLLNVAKLLHMA